uniref:Uncharacterized protein n=1 Tax=Globodera rostochiensis TaxID=31243 RepID=A0A914I8Q6_GLORO
MRQLCPRAVIGQQFPGAIFSDKYDQAKSPTNVTFAAAGEAFGVIKGRKRLTPENSRDPSRLKTKLKQRHRISSPEGFSAIPTTNAPGNVRHGQLAPAASSVHPLKLPQTSKLIGAMGTVAGDGEQMVEVHSPYTVLGGGTVAGELNGRGKSVERRQSVRTKIASFEAREDQFLAEIEQMRAECCEDGTATSSNEEGGGLAKLEEIGEAPTMLGTLCTLIGEIGKLRRENRRLRRRFVVPELRETEGAPPQANSARGVSSLPRRLIPNIPRGSSAFSCLQLQSSSASCSSAVSSLFGGGTRRPPMGKMFGRRQQPQAQAERLSSPPPGPKKTAGSLLTVSAYSADLSSDASLNRRKRILEEPPQSEGSSGPKCVGDEVGGGQHQLFGWDAGGDNGAETETPPAGLRRPRRGMARRAEMQKSPKSGEDGKQFLRLSASVTSGTSPAGSSSSACSSVEPLMAHRSKNNAQNGNRSSVDAVMSASRCSSLLDLFGIRRRKPSPSSISSAEGGGRALGAFANVLDGLLTRRMAGTGGAASRKFGMFAPATNRRHSQHLPCHGDEASPPYSPAVSPMFADGYSSGEMAKLLGAKPKTGQTVGEGRMESEPNLMKNWHKSNESFVGAEGIGPNRHRKGRPRSCFLGPPQSDCGQPRDRRQRTESGKTDAKRGPQRTSSLEQELCLQMQLLRARNARLIGQLREKSGQLSVAETRADKFGREIDQFRAQKRFDASMEKISARTQMGRSIERDQLGDSFRAQLQSLKLEAQRQQQMALNASRCDRQSLQASLAEVERLQHEKCALLQANLHDVVEPELRDLLASYDALYAFAAGIVRKMGQMRERMAERNAELLQLELDALQSQSQTLLAQTQSEWSRVQIRLVANPFGAEHHRQNRRPASYHGQSLAERMANFGHLRQQMFLPFKLLAQRLRHHNAKKMDLFGSKTNESPEVGDRFDALVEANEQNIELEFLRLFKSARTLARICRGNENYAETETEWAKATEKIVTKITESALQSDLISPNLNIGIPSVSQIASRPLQRRTQSGGLRQPERPAAISPPKMRGKSVQQQQQSEQNSPLNSPLIKFRRLSAIFGGWSARAEEANVSPPPPSLANPVIGRRVPLPNSPQLIHRRQRPALSRQFSIHSSKDSALSPYFFTTNQFPQENANKNCFLQKCVPPFYECPPPLMKMRPSPSAPPLSLNNLASMTRLPQPNLGVGATSSTRRPLTRTSAASESPSLRDAKRFGRVDIADIVQKGSDKQSTSQKATRQNGERDSSEGRIGSESRSSSTSRLPKAIGQSAKKLSQNMPAENLKAAKKAGISWLSRLRRKEGPKPND